MASSSVRSATLLDTVQYVPQLLEYVSSSNGVKSLRLLSKALSSFAVRQVRSFCVRLLPVPDKDLLEVGVLLENTQLQHLRVDIIVATSKCCRCPLTIKANFP